MFFLRRSLRDLGLRVVLGHEPHKHCPTKEEHPGEFTVIHTNGIHVVNVQFCRCRGIPRRRQLLSIGWYPSSPLKPQTCATISVLQQFHLLNLQGKLPAYSFYRALEYLTDNTGMHPPPVSTSYILH